MLEVNGNTSGQGFRDLRFANADLRMKILFLGLTIGGREKWTEDGGQLSVIGGR